MDEAWLPVPATFIISQEGKIVYKQFDYDYADWELKEWAAIIKNNMMPQAAAGGIFFNNHVRGQAPKNALRLIDLLLNHSQRQKAAPGTP